MTTTRGFIAALLLVGFSSWGMVRRVTNVIELVAAVGAANPGDEIVLANGVYAVSAKISLTRPGTSTARITLRSEQPLGARINSTTVIAFGVAAPFWTIEGLEMHGQCADDSDCEHAIQVTGLGSDFVLRGNKLVDFNAQLKVNANPPQGTTAAQIPHRGLIEANEIFDTRGRMTSNPVTKLNIDTGDDWIVRDNYLHDFFKNGGNTVSYGSFMKSGGARGTYERNLVICDTGTPPGGGARIGLSFGGGGTAAQFCNPGFDASVPCDVEHRDGIMRNNIIVNCSDVAVYLNRAANSRVLYNTFVATSGVDYRFSTTTGVAIGNVLASVIRTRDQGTVTQTSNQSNVSAATFAGWYQNASAGDLRIKGDVSSLVGAGPTNPAVLDDFCGRTRPSLALTLGALEHSLGSCATTKPSLITMMGADAGVSAQGDAGVTVDAGAPSDAGLSNDAGADADGGITMTADVPRGCGCTAGTPGALALAVLLAHWWRRKRESGSQSPATHTRP